MQRSHQINRYFEAARVFGAVTLGRTQRNIDNVVGEIQELRSRLPLLGSTAVTFGIDTSGSLLRGIGRSLRSVASDLDHRHKN